MKCAVTDAESAEQLSQLVDTIVDAHQRGEPDVYAVRLCCRFHAGATVSALVAGTAAILTYLVETRTLYPRVDRCRSAAEVAVARAVAASARDDDEMVRALLLAALPAGDSDAAEALVQSAIDMFDASVAAWARSPGGIA